MVLKLTNHNTKSQESIGLIIAVVHCLMPYRDFILRSNGETFTHMKSRVGSMATRRVIAKHSQLFRKSYREALTETSNAPRSHYGRSCDPWRATRVMITAWQELKNAQSWRSARHAMDINPHPPQTSLFLFAWIISTFRFWQIYLEYLIFDLATKSSIELILQRLSSCERYRLFYGGQSWLWGIDCFPLKHLLLRRFFPTIFLLWHILISAWLR